MPSGSLFTACASGIYLGIRVLSSFARPAATFPDTVGYETLSFLGSGDRFWPIPFAFRLADSVGGRIALHVLVGWLSWTWLSVVLAKGARFPRTVAGATLLVGLSPQVVRYDLALVSESLATSLTVAAVAATLWVVRSPSLVSRLMWLPLVTLCGFVRPTHLIVVFVCLAGAVTCAVKSRGRTMLVSSLVLVCLSAWGWSLLAANRGVSELNLRTVLAQRIFPKEDRYNWFVDRGMPDIPGLRESIGYDYVGQLPDDLATYVDLPLGQPAPSSVRVGGFEFARWVRTHGWFTYARYTFTHPSDTWSHVTRYTSAVLDPPNDDFLPLSPRTIVPRLLFRGWWLWILLGVAALGAGFVRPGGARTTRAIVAMAGTTALVHLATLLASGIEHQRHSATVAVLVRVLALCAVANAAAMSREPSDSLAGDAVRRYR